MCAIGGGSTGHKKHSEAATSPLYTRLEALRRMIMGLCANVGLYKQNNGAVLVVEHIVVTNH